MIACIVRTISPLTPFVNTDRPSPFKFPVILHGSVQVVCDVGRIAPCAQSAAIESMQVRGTLRPVRLVHVHEHLWWYGTATRFRYMCVCVIGQKQVHRPRSEDSWGYVCRSKVGRGYIVTVLRYFEGLLCLRLSLTVAYVYWVDHYTLVGDGRLCV
eukprot:COSAG02_NODE_13580_length_1376_cov_2.341425_1_plen_156_part_00